jgi:hypothetical protein
MDNKYLVGTRRTKTTFATEEEAFEYARKHSNTRYGAIVADIEKHIPLYRMENGYISYQY